MIQTFLEYGLRRSFNNKEIQGHLEFPLKVDVIS